MTEPTLEDVEARWRKLAAELAAAPLVGQGELFDLPGEQADLFADAEVNA